MPGILSLAIGAVFFSAAVVAIVTKLMMPQLPWGTYVALGAIVPSPDTVSARAVLQGVRLPRRLITLLEGESLLNDVAGLVLFQFAVAAVLTGSFQLGTVTGTFLLLAVGGIAAGAAFGGLWVFLLRRLCDDTLIITATVLVCWSAYIAAVLLHFSGVIAVVTAGLTCGWNQHVVFNARVRWRSGRCFCSCSKPLFSCSSVFRSRVAGSGRPARHGGGHNGAGRAAHRRGSRRRALPLDLRR